MQQIEIDILENNIHEKYPGLLNILLRDQTTKQNIFWATDNYVFLGEDYQFHSQIKVSSITGDNGHIIMPRVKKNKNLQQSRIRVMAEVFTPSWICNAQNNLIDFAWFGINDVFNSEITLQDGTHIWEVNKSKIRFPVGKTWVDYIRETRLEMACGEAPYVTSRYDTTTGEFIHLENRIGLLDRKLRIINENTDDSRKWLEAAINAYKNIYAFEWQGDSLLLAREAMLITFIENYKYKFGKEPSLRSIQYIACIISWNIWQMDGLRGVIPRSCDMKHLENITLFGEESRKTKCEGCRRNQIKKHNGIYCQINDWYSIDPLTKKNRRTIKFIDML